MTKPPPWNPSAVRVLVLSAWRVQFHTDSVGGSPGLGAPERGRLHLDVLGLLEDVVPGQHREGEDDVSGILAPQQQFWGKCRVKIWRKTNKPR